MADLEFTRLKLIRADLVLDSLEFSLQIIEIDSLPKEERYLNFRGVIRGVLVRKIKELDDQIDEIDEKIRQLSH